MSVNIKNILVLLNEKYRDLEETQPSQEEKLIAESVSDILEGYNPDQVEVSHSLEFDECEYFFYFIWLLIPSLRC